jgi:hypothetical protein
MGIEEKIDQVIAILLRIEEKFNNSPVTAVVEVEKPVQSTKINKPTKSQLEFKRHIEFANKFNSVPFFTSIRKRAAEMMEARKRNPNLYFEFEATCTEEIDRRIAKTGAQFYKDLKLQNEVHCKAIEFEGEQVLQRAINRLTARA